MSYIFGLHRERMTRQLRPFLDENTRATPLQLRPAYIPQKPYPYFVQKMRQEQGPLIAECPCATRFIPDQPVFIPNEAFNPATWWNSEMRNKRPWVTEVESPYRGWPRTRLQSGILV